MLFEVADFRSSYSALIIEATVMAGRDVQAPPGALLIGDFVNTTADQFERAIDDALKMTFPASDPIAISGLTHAPSESSLFGASARLPLVASPTLDPHIGC